MNRYAPQNEAIVVMGQSDTDQIWIESIYDKKNTILWFNGNGGHGADGIDNP